jgi:hypothetical protein
MVVDQQITDSSLGEAQDKQKWRRHGFSPKVLTKWLGMRDRGTRSFW